MSIGIILLGHGSRSADAQLTVDSLVSQIEKSGLFEYVTGAMLQFNQPDLPSAISNAVLKGIDRLIVVPIFIFKGIHMKEDIPEILEQERLKHPKVRIELADNIGADIRLAEILLDRIREVV